MRLIDADAAASVFKRHIESKGFEEHFSDYGTEICLCVKSLYQQFIDFLTDEKCTPTIEPDCGEVNISGGANNA